MNTDILDHWQGMPLRQKILFDERMDIVRQFVNKKFGSRQTHVGRYPHYAQFVVEAFTLASKLLSDNPKENPHEHR
jgi:hypothetical protein